MTPQGKLKLVLCAWLLMASSVSADDTPFMTFQCSYDRASEDKTFQIRFKNDDSAETETWSSVFKRTKMRFEKVNKSMVRVSISTGLPLVSHAVPEEFRFTAPLNNDEFSFSFGMKPLSVKSEFFSLVCSKIKE